MAAKHSRFTVLFFSAFLLMSLAVLSSVTHANTVDQMSASPYESLAMTGEKLFTRISNNQQELQKFPEVMRDIIEEELMPMIDYKYAAYKVLGTNLRKTTPEQRSNFVNSMRQYLVRTYATALNSYSNQQVVFEADKEITNKKFISVSTTIVDPNKADINIAFMMRKGKKSQQWKVYDMVVEGISLLSTKKAELNQRISSRGLDQVTLELASIAK